MLWLKAFHIIFMVSWFAGLFYLPRLFVYHANCLDEFGNARFKTMEKRLLFAITTPAGILTTLTGGVLVYWSPGFLHSGWLHAKMFFVAVLWVFHILCGYYTKRFAHDNNTHQAVFYRWFNEVPTLLLVFIVILVVVKPF